MLGFFFLKLIFLVIISTYIFNNVLEYNRTLQSIYYEYLVLNQTSSSTVLSNITRIL